MAKADMTCTSSASPASQNPKFKFKLIERPVASLLSIRHHVVPSHPATRDGTSHAPGPSCLRLPTKKRTRRGESSAERDRARERN